MSFENELRKLLYAQEVEPLPLVDLKKKIMELYQEENNMVK